MGIRHLVEDFAQLGPLPDSDAAEDVIALHQSRLERITPPISDEEAARLIVCFGPDDCYGLAWTLLHLIESAPGGAPIDAEPNASANQWVRRLWERSHR